MIGRWKSYYLHGITDGEAYFKRTIETIKTVSAEELQALAQTWLQPETFYELVVV
jgi:predicted Zn-dependent peptidase